MPKVHGASGRKAYSIEIMVESLYQDRTASWVRIVSGIDMYVTESSKPKRKIIELRRDLLPVQDHDCRPQ